MRAGGLLRADSPAEREFAGSWLRNVRAALLSVVLPAGCRICERILTEATCIPICTDCLGSFVLSAGPFPTSAEEVLKGPRYVVRKFSSAPRALTMSGVVMPSSE